MSTPAVMRTMTTFTSAADVVTKDAIEKVNQVQTDVEIKKTPDGRGWGLYARKGRTIQPGHRVFRGKGLSKSNKRCVHSVQTSWEEHTIMDLPAILVNHSCDANLGIKKNDIGAYDFYAIKPIASGEEFLWDYETVEAEISGWKCTCGTAKCRGHLKGFQAHGPQILENYGEEYVAPYLLNKEDSEDEENHAAASN